MEVSRLTIGVDTGSAHQGVGVLAHTPGAPFPFALLASARIPVEPGNLAPAAAATWAIIEAHPDAHVVIEGGSPYGSGGRIVSAAAVALQHAARLGDRVLVRCQDVGRAVRTLTRNGWAFRVVSRELRGLDAKGRPTVIRDTHVRAALALYLSPEDCARLASVDERDAAGAAIGVMLLEEDAAAKVARSVRHERGPAAPRVRGSGKRTPAKPKTLAERLEASRKRAEAKAGIPRKTDYPVTVGGVTYPSLRDAALAVGVGQDALRNRLARAARGLRKAGRPRKAAPASAPSPSSPSPPPTAAPPATPDDLPRPSSRSPIPNKSPAPSK